MTGVVGFVDASNIPPGGLNSVTGVVEDAENEITEEIFSSGHLYYAGQSVGLVVADTYEHARYERCRGRRRHFCAQQRTGSEYEWHSFITSDLDLFANSGFVKMLTDHFVTIWIDQT